MDGVLDDATYNGDAVATVGSVSFAAPDMTWTGNLAAGASATVTYSVTVNNPDTGDRILTNTVESATPGNNCPVGGTDPRCTVTVTDLVPGLDIVTSADKASAIPGAVVHYTITATNTGQTAYTGASFTDPLSDVLDDAAYNGDAAATAGSVSFASPNLTWTGNLAVGAVATITFSVTVNNPDTGNKILASTITSATVGNNCPVSGGTDTACTVTVTVVNATTLTFTMTADTASAPAGGVVHYTITVANSGLTAYAGATFTAGLGGVLDDASYDNDAVATAGTVTFTSPSLTWTGNVPASGTVTITYSVTVNNPDTGNHILTTTVTSASTGSNCGAGSADPRCTATVDVAALSISATANVSTTSPGSDVDYTITATNTGQAPYSDASITLQYVNIAEDATYNGDLAATSGTVTVNSSTQATWTGDLAPGATVTITYSVTVIPPDASHTSKTLTLTVTSTALGNNCPVGGTAPACTSTVAVLIPALTITKTANSTTTVPGGVVTYTITVVDTGDTPYTGATVTDDLTGVLGDAAYNNDAAASVGTLSYASPVLTWTGNLAVGTTVTITYSVTVRNPDTGGKLMVNTVASAATGSTCPPGGTSAGCIVTVTVLTPALTITQAASPAAATPGQQVSYTITVTDSGQTSYTGATVTDPLSGVLDDASYDNDAAATTGTVTFASPALTWTGNLTPGQAATITFTVTVNNPDTGDHVLTSTLTSTTSGNNCRTRSTDPRCTATIDVAGLTIVNTANVSTTTPGSTVGYTIAITNTGQTSYAGATVTDPLTGVLDDAAFNNDAATTVGSVDYASPNLTWTGNLTPGQAATITFTVVVNNPDTGDKILTSTLTSAAAGSTCPSSGPAPACTSTVTVLIPALTITKTAATTTTTPGSAVGYTITVTDSGQTPYTGATVTDALDGLLTDATYDNDAAATTGAVSYTSPDLTWTGNLTSGQVATITYTITINNPDTGDKQLINVVTSTTAGSTCPPGTTSPACTVTVIDLIPALTIAKTATVAATTPGSTVGYTVTVDDTGQTPYTAATVTDALGGVLTDATYNHNATATIGTISYASPTLTWTGDPHPRRHRHHHLLGHRERPRYRPRSPVQHRCLDRAGQHLPGRIR